MNVVKRTILLILLKSRPELRLLLRVSVCLPSRYLGSAQQLLSPVCCCFFFVVFADICWLHLENVSVLKKRVWEGSVGGVGGGGVLGRRCWGHVTLVLPGDWRRLAQEKV